MKQKTNLRASISVKQSKLMGSTFTKSNKGEDRAKLSQVCMPRSGPIFLFEVITKL